MEALDCPLAAGFVWSSEESSEEDIQEGSALSRRSSSMSSQTEASPSLHPVSARASTEDERQRVTERRENNRIASERHRRNQRSELVLLRHKTVRYFEDEVQLHAQLLRVSNDKNAALREAEAQKRTIEELVNRLGVCAQEYGDLQTKFSVLVNAHCEALQGGHAVAQMTAVQAPPQNGPQCAATDQRLA